MDENKNIIPENEAAPSEPEKQETPKKEKKKFSSFFKSTKFKKGGMATVFTACFIVIIVLINIFFSALESRFPSLSVDLTTNKIYSLSEDAVDAAKDIDTDTTIYILASEDTAKSDTLLASYGLQYSQVSVLCEKIKAENPKIAVKYVDLDLNPTFASQDKYASYTLSTGSVIIENSKRIRVLGIGDMYTQEYDSNYQATYYMNVDSALTTALMQVKAETVPVVSIASGSHGEMLTSGLTSFQTLLESNNFEFKTFDILTQDIPEDTTIIMLPSPTTDYTEEELDKLDTFLSSNEAGNRSIWVTFHPTQPELPNLSNFLAGWGMEVENKVIFDTDSANLIMSNGSYFLSDLTGELNIGGTHSDVADYGYFVTPQSRPIDFLFGSNALTTTYPIAKSADTAYLVDSDSIDENTDAPTTNLDSYNTVGLAQKTSKISDVNYTKSVVAFGSSWMFTSTYLSSTFGNSEYLVDLARYTSGIQDSTVGVTQNKVSATTYDISITTAARNFFGLGIFTILIPLSLIAAGLVVYLKRRHL